jgi:hypothetical protein
MVATAPTFCGFSDRDLGRIRTSLIKQLQEAKNLDFVCQVEWFSSGAMALGNEVFCTL